MSIFLCTANRSGRFQAALLGTALVLTAVSCNRHPAKPVAQVENAWVGQPQWTFFQEHHAAGSPSTTLDALVRREVAWQQALKRGLLKGGDWSSFQARNRTTILGKAYIDRLPGAPAITEAMAKGHFMQSSEQRHVLHVLCKTQEQAQAALGRIKKGEDFEKVATALSTDPSVASNHGDIGWIKREQVVQPFAEATFGAKTGELCGPFQTEFGWHVAKVLEVKAPTEADYQMNKAAVLAGLEEMNGSQRRPEALVPLRTKYPLTIDRAVLNLDRTTDAAPGDEERIAGKVGSRKISLKDLKRYLADVMNVSGQSHGLGPETKGKFLEMMADDLRLELAAEKAGLEKLPEIQAALWDSEREAALRAFSQSFLGSYKAQEPELTAHYQAHQDRFRGAGAVKVYFLVADQAQAIDKAAHESMKGAAWPKLVAKYANKESTGKWDAGWLEISSLQKVLPKNAIDALQKIGGGSLIGPVPSPEGFMLFKVLERRPGDALPLKDCLEEVQKDYFRTQGEAVVNKYLDGEGRSGLSIKTFPENAGVRKGS